MLASVTDVSTKKIPNWLTFPLVLLGVVVQGFLPNTGDVWYMAVGAGLIGAMLAFVLHFVLWQLKLEGAGDAKLMMGVGSLVGWQNMLEMTAWRYVLLVPYALVAITALGRWGHFREALRWTLGKFMGRDVGERPEAKHLPFAPVILLSLPLAWLTTVLDFFAP